MTNQTRLVFLGSPFLPKIDDKKILDLIISELAITHEPAATISLTIVRIMEAHTVLLRLHPDSLEPFHTTENNLQQLVAGYRYPLETIQASAVCRSVPTREERLILFEEIITSTHQFNLLLAQEQMAKDLHATCNLLTLDPSAALVFQFLKDYPYSTDEYFLAGIDIAARIFFGLATEVSKRTGDSAWLTVDYSLRPYSPPNTD